MSEKARALKNKCPECGSEDVKHMSSPYGEEEYIYCNACKQISVVTKVAVDDKQNKP